MRMPKYQSGLSTTGLLITLLAAGFAIMCLFKMVPAYMDDRFIQEGLKSLTENVDQIDEMSDEQIRKQIGRFFVVNNVRSQSEKDIKIERKQDRTLVKMEYEVRVPIFANVDVVMTFNNVWDSKRPYDCCKPDSEM
ncbi:DUF4845 domain-containing protein [Aestuariicella hydrocarbonica]|uniref:DUF4845 domain-containing protein n=1 Tax=Pseudomaricurvus hydrocarbonicus TaxID=1470433 RepID=A0A9E5JRP5_9GAMM|nr:DUF4845 domain-containing protein [Aestuariicella hydrocarbonica]NHO65547.1 DUF4845 domain-containing protein [Aestuariicella hydrocarbonica]